MKAYRFRLEVVARVRAIEERTCRDRFMMTLRELRQAEERLRADKEALATIEGPTGETTIEVIVWTSDQAGRLADAVRVGHEAVVVAEVASAEARTAWSEAAKRSGLLDRLEEKSRRRWQDEVARAEGAELDDMANSRYGLAGAGR
jgi:flagellar export protein FliJ